MTRTLEDCFEVVETSLPVLVTVTKEMNEPRYPSLRGLLRANKEKIIIWNHDDLALEKEKIGLDGSPTKVIKVFTPDPPKKGKILSGDISEVAEQLLKELKERKTI